MLSHIFSDILLSRATHSDSNWKRTDPFKFRTIELGKISMDRGANKIEPKKMGMRKRSSLSSKTVSFARYGK